MPNIGTVKFVFLGSKMNWRHAGLPDVYAVYL